MNWNATDYAHNSGGQARFAFELLDKLQLRPHQSVLDIGCGDGKITQQIAASVAPALVVGIDSSEAMIDYAHQHHRADNLQFYCMDATAIVLPQQFDIVFSNAALHWVADHPAVLRGLASVLKTGGKLLFQMGGAGNAAELIPVIEHIQCQETWRKYFVDFRWPYYFPAPSDYREYLQQCGFVARRVELIDKNMEFATHADFAGWLRSAWFPITDCAPNHLRNILLEEIVTGYCDRHPEHVRGEAVVVRMKRLEVAAERE